MEDVDCCDPDGARYYVHWPEHDRRHDAWLPADEVRAVQATAIATRAPKTAPKVVATRTMTRAAAEQINSGRATPVAPTAPPKLHAQRTVDHTRAQDSKFFSRPRNVKSFVFGNAVVDAWYFTPHPIADLSVRSALEEVGHNCAMAIDAPMRVSTNSPAPSPAASPSVVKASKLELHVCPFCVAVFADHASLAESHLASCQRHPPGREVYRDAEQGVIVFEADGSVHRRFAESIALISKAFLEHKSLDYDTTPFVFYTVCFITQHGCVVAGYFSREKRNPEKFNLSCILTLPQHQGRGLGRFLVEMSYELSRREGRLGSPEKPLSDLGEKTYHSFWREAVLDALMPLAHLEGTPVKLSDIMMATGMVQADTVWALRALRMLDNRSQEITIHITPQMVSAHLEAKTRRVARGDVRFEASLLAWRPTDYDLVTLSRGELLDHTAVLPASAVAQIGEKRAR